jgi:hypothetical protein
MLRIASVVAAFAVALLPPVAVAEGHSSLCVGSGAGCYPSIQAAVDAARAGNTINVARGTFSGGVTIDKSLSLIGAGSGETVIRGGGPVVTIGTFLAKDQPTVSIAGVTITGGVATSSRLSQEWTGTDNVIALGGGIEILPAADYSRGATVNLRDSVVTRNRVTPTATVPSGIACPGGDCALAWAKGGGIDNWGRLSLTNTTVGDNVAAGAASDADGAGINVWWPGSLELNRSKVTGNRAIASAPNGRFAEGGGIFMDPGVTLTLEASDVSTNEASLSSTLPYFVPGADPLDMNANGGGIHVGDGSTVSIHATTLSGNTVRVDDPNGEPVAFDAALHPGDGPLDVRDSRIENNYLAARVGSSADVGPSGSALDINGPATVKNTAIIGNTAVVTTETGTAAVNGAVYSGAAASRPAVIVDSVISDNIARAASDLGPASVQGGGLLNDGGLQLRSVQITGNSGSAKGASGFVQGGGIWNGSQFNPPPSTLTLQDVTIVHNTLRASSGLTVKGGGMFTAFPVNMAGTQITQNAPDQCYGC